MTYTPVHNRFWSDGWIRRLNALDRYLFLYLLSNGRAGKIGIYELPIDLMASESGIDEKDLKMSMLSRLEPKMFYKEGWVIITNYPKHLIGDGPKFRKGVQLAFAELPPKIQEIAKDCGYPIHTLSIPYRGFGNRIEENRIEENTNITANAGFLVIEETPPKKTKTENVKYEELCKWAEARRGFMFISRVKQYSALKRAKACDISVTKLKNRWIKCEGDAWREGFDWATVVATFDKEP